MVKKIIYEIPRLTTVVLSHERMIMASAGFSTTYLDEDNVDVDSSWSEN